MFYGDAQRSSIQQVMLMSHNKIYCFSLPYQWCAFITVPSKRSVPIENLGGNRAEASDLGWAVSPAGNNHSRPLNRQQLIRFASLSQCMGSQCMGNKAFLSFIPGNICLMETRSISAQQSFNRMLWNGSQLWKEWKYKKSHWKVGKKRKKFDMFSH